MPDWLNAVITLAGIVLGFAGVALTFVTFFAPGLIQEFALKNPARWMVVPSANPENKTYRHKIFSGFTIEVGFSNPVSDDTFFEPWMKALYRPDSSATSYYVTLFFNGLPMDRLLFIQYDGGRNFIPVPIMERVGDKLYAIFSLKQHQLANIAGYDHFNRPFGEVAKCVTDSRFNPYFLKGSDADLSDADLKERLERLTANIEALKLRTGTPK